MNTCSTEKKNSNVRFDAAAAAVVVVVVVVVVIIIIIIRIGQILEVLQLWYSPFPLL
jgi:hypothetical protein